MKKVYLIFFIIIIAYTLYLTACSSTELDLFKSETAANYTSILSRSSNDYDFDNKEYIAVNEYLTSFTQTGYMQTNTFELTSAPNSSLLKIALLYCMNHTSDAFEPGSYWLGRSNQRIPAKVLHEAVFNLFKKDIEPQTIENLYYENGYYYWNTANIKTENSFFALITRMETMANNQYSVTFNLYNTRTTEEETIDNKYYIYSNDDAIREFPRGSINDLTAILKATDLTDANSMQLIYMQKNAVPESNIP